MYFIVDVIDDFHINLTNQMSCRNYFFYHLLLGCYGIELISSSWYDAFSFSMLSVSWLENYFKIFDFRIVICKQFLKTTICEVMVFMFCVLYYFNKIFVVRSTVTLTSVLGVSYKLMVGVLTWTFIRCYRLYKFKYDMYKLQLHLNLNIIYTVPLGTGIH